MEQNTYATITTYYFPTTPQSKIRVTKKQDGTVWFAFEDISHATGIAPAQILDGIDPTHLAAFVTYVFKDNKGTVEIDMISFARLQLVIARSKMVRARAFFQWVENEIMGIKDDQEDLVELPDTIVPGGQPVDIQNFTFKNSKDHGIRAIIMEDGSIWFVAKDVCDVLELVNSRKAISTLDEDEKADVTISDTSSNGTVQRRSMKAVSESGLYALVFKSRKPEAKKFRKWVTSEVLPQIRKTGAYMPSQPTIGQAPMATAVPHANQDHLDNNLDQVGARAVTLTPGISPKAATAFVQAATDIFWGIENAMNEYKAMETNLKKAKKDVATIIRSAKEVFPDMADSINMLGGQAGVESKLEVEMR